MKRVCLFWEKESGAGRRNGVNEKTCLSSYLSFSNNFFRTFTDKDTAKEARGESNIIFFGNNLIEHILELISTDSVSEELRNSLLSLACVGVRTQSSVFLSLAEKDTPGRNLIEKCVAIAKEGIEKIQSLRDNSSNFAVLRREWVKRSVPLIWHATHLLSAIVNTLFVDYEHLQRVWFLLITVEYEVSQILKAEKAFLESSKGKQYYFILLSIVKEMYFLAYCGTVKVSSLLDQIKRRNANGSEERETETKKEKPKEKEETETMKPSTKYKSCKEVYNSKSFHGLKLLLSTLLSDEYELWLQEVGEDQEFGEDLLTNNSIFVPGLEYREVRGQVVALCNRMGITMHANLLEDVAELQFEKSKGICNLQFCSFFVSFLYLQPAFSLRLSQLIHVILCIITKGFSSRFSFSSGA